MAGAAAGGAGAATGSGSGAAAVTPTSGGAPQSAATSAIGGSTNFGNPQSPDYQSNLAAALFSQNGMVTSEANDIGSTYSTAIAGLNTSQQQTNAGLAAGLATNMVQAQRTGAGLGVAEETARRGMGMNTAIISNIKETTDDNINQLNAQYEQAIATGDATTAGKVADLQVAAMTAKLNAQNQVFTNMTTIASTLNSAQQTQIQQESQNLAEQQAIANIGLQFGIPVTPGMSLGDMVNAAAPKASQKELADLGLTYAQTTAANAQAAQAEAGINALISPVNANVFAGSYLGNLMNVSSQTAQQNAQSMVKVIQAQGAQGLTLFQQSVTGQINQVYNGGSTSTTPDQNALNQTFTQAFANVSPQQFGQIDQQLKDQYTNPSKGLGQMATPAQLKAASVALVDAENAYLTVQNPSLQASPNAVTNFFNKLLGQTGAAQTEL